MTDDQLLTALRELDPGRADTSERLPEWMLVRAFAPASPPPRRRPRRAWAAIAVAACAVLAVLAVGPGREGTQDTRAAAALRRVAGIAEAQAAPRGGPILYFRWRSEGLSTFGDRPAFSVYTPAIVEEWIAPDGSGLVRTRPLPRRSPGPRDRARWVLQGRPSVARPAPSSERRGPGGFLGRADDNLPPLSELPTDPGRLGDLLRERARRTDVPVEVKTFELASAVLEKAGASPDLRAAAYQVLAGVRGVKLLGSSTVGIESDYSGARKRQVVVFDPQTSRVIATRVDLLEPTIYIDARSEGTTLMLRSGRVDRVGHRPKKG